MLKQNGEAESPKKQLRFDIDAIRRHETAFSKRDGQIYVRSNKREHSNRLSGRIRYIFRCFNDFFDSFCCRCGIPDDKVGGREVGEPVIFKTKEERLVEEWNALKKEQIEKVGLREVKVLLKKLNASVPQRQILEWLKTYDKDNDKKLNFEEFKEMYFSLRSVPDLREDFLRAKLHETDDDKMIDQLGITCSPKWQWAKYEFLVAQDLVWFFNWASNGKDIKSEGECEKIIKRYSKDTFTKSPETPKSSKLHDIFEKDSPTKNTLFWRFPKSPKEAPTVEEEAPLKLSYEAFVAMLTDLRSNSAIDPMKSNAVYQDMTKPLSHYFISASHNSYLLGNQLNSESSPLALQRVLKLGVRVLELDCWDGSDGFPIVNHGHTLCKPTTFESCIKTINKHAFDTTEYPLIITIENHCSRKQQKKQVKLMTTILKEKLFIWDLTEFLNKYNIEQEEALTDDILSSIGPCQFLSPEELKHKIVIRDRPIKKMTKKEKVDLKGKVKKMQNHHQQTSSSNLSALASRKLFSRSKSNDYSTVTAISNGSVVTKEKQKRRGSFNSQSSNDYDEDTIKQTFIKQLSKIKEKETKTSKGVHRALLRVMYIKNVTLKLPKLKEKVIEESISKTSSIDSSQSYRKSQKKLMILTEPDFASSSSLNENDMKKLVSPGHNSAVMNTYTKHHLIRVYPAATRINSSNFSPVPAWNAGCQIVALNYQSLKFKVWLNHGKFLLNKRCGFLLKPKDMLQAEDIGVKFSLKRQKRVGDKQKEKQELIVSRSKWDLNLGKFKPKKLRVTVVSAHYLPKKSSDLKYKNDPNQNTINPFVELRLRGLHRQDFKTKWVERNGFNPRWQETFEFTVYHPELCLLAFIIKSRDNANEGSFVAQRVLPINAIRPGYRTVSLLFKNCSHIDAAYLVCRFCWVSDETSGVIASA